MTFEALQTELLARGFDYLGTTAAGQVRVKQFLNDAYLTDICDPYPWMFLEATTTGTGTVTITDLRDVLYVLDTSRKRVLPSADIRDIAATAPDFESKTGSASAYYIDGDTLKLFPVSPSTELSVRYIKVPPELDGPTDVPVLPARWHGLIVDFAVPKAYRDDDDFDEAVATEDYNFKRLGRMVEAEFSKNLDNTQYVSRTGWIGDYY